MPTPLSNDRWGHKSNCFVCEQTNESGLQIPFVLNDAQDQVTADFTLGAEHSGAPSLVHGGVSLAVLDEAQAWAVIAIAGRWGLTRATQATFDGAVFVDHPNTVKAWVIDVGLKQVRTEAVIVDEGGVEVVRSQSSFTVVGIVDESQRAIGLNPEHFGLLGKPSDQSAHSALDAAQAVSYDDRSADVGAGNRTLGDRNVKQQLDDVLKAGVGSGGIAGGVAAVVDRDGELYLGSAGERSVGTGAAMSTDTVGAIFSMTKAVTAVAAMQLVEQGRLDLDADAGLVCPELLNPVVLDGFDAGGTPITRPAAGPITLRQLLTHTAGFVYDIWNAEMGRWYGATGTPSVFSLEKKALQTPLMFDPGTQWQYGINLDWVGLLVEQVTGQTLGEYMQQHIFGPLGMSDTGFAPGDDQIARLSAMHTRLPDGGLAAIELPGPENPEFEMGGGGLVSTMSDYARFIRMVLNDGELDGARVLQAETIEAMAQNQMGDLRVSELASSAPMFSQDAELFPGEEKSWGMSFQVHEEASSTGAPAGTLTWAGLANSYFWIDRQNGIGGCYLSQLLPFADSGAVDVFYNIMRTVYAER